MARNKTVNTMSIEKQREMLCDNLSFAGTEAYKQLRTSIMFSLPKDDGGTGRIIAVTGASKGDGKSTTAVNLANVLAQTGAKVLIIEGDLRMPTMATRLQVKSAPGLSNILVGNAKVSEALQKSSTETPFYVISSGDLPPNPSELLASDRMQQFLKTLSRTFDYIVLDLPPVNIVTDPLTVADYVDGYVMVVHLDKTTRREVDQAMTKLNLANAKVLGFVLNGYKLKEHRYGKYKYSKYNKYKKYAEK